MFWKSCFAAAGKVQNYLLEIRSTFIIQLKANWEELLQNLKKKKIAVKLSIKNYHFKPIFSGQKKGTAAAEEKNEMQYVVQTNHANFTWTF